MASHGSAWRAADGTFATPKQLAALPECLSLDCIAVGGSAAALLAGTGLGPVLLVPDGKARKQKVVVLRGRKPVELAP